MIGNPKISLSKDLEDYIFRNTPTRREVSLLKHRCEHYQSFEPNDWKPVVFPAYSQYFGFLSALKVKSVLQELTDYGYLDSLSKPVRLVDFGAGTLGGSLGAIDFFRSQGHEVDSLSALDREMEPMAWAKSEFQKFLPARVDLRQGSLESQSISNSLVLCVDVWNEAGLMTPDVVMPKMLSVLKNLDAGSLLIWIEPASKPINQALITLRDQLLHKLGSEIHLLLPCTHEKACPALADNEWCHEDRDYAAPGNYWSLLNQLGFRRSTLSYSFLVFGKQTNRFNPQMARMVSRNIKSKGRCDKWLCADGKRWKQSLLTRHHNEETAPIFESERGNILDCSSTLFKPRG